MTYIDMNLTYSKQFCDIAVGGYMGIGSILYVLLIISLLGLGFYTVYRVTKIFIKEGEHTK